MAGMPPSAVFNEQEMLFWLTIDSCVFCVCVSVSRLHCESESFKMDLILDVNTQLYPVDLGQSPMTPTYINITSTTEKHKQAIKPL